ncbi:MAG: glycosyltransferase family 9 protein [Ignavibacteria bacterium]|jgi:ADP-heptose:LPS heptosyltransferase
MIVKHEVKKILIIKLRGIGDVVLSTIVLDNLKKDFPSAQIDFLTEKPSNIFLSTLPQIDNVILFNKGNLISRAKQILEIRKKRYDLILDFYTNPATALLTRLSGAKYKAGFPYGSRKSAYNIWGPEERDKYHAAQLHLEFLKKNGLSHSAKSLYFYLEEIDNSFLFNELSEIISKNKLLIGISPSGGWKSKKCDPEKFAEIADAVVEKYDAQFLILWGPGDYDEAVKIRKLMKSEPALAPKTDIIGMGACIEYCDILIANDSGPMHISTALGTPVLSLHGPTDPNLQGPYGDKHEWIHKDDLDCIVCNLLECPKNHECFLELDINEILDKVESLLKKNNIKFTVNEKN